MSRAGEASAQGGGSHLSVCKSPPLRRMICRKAGRVPSGSRLSFLLRGASKPQRASHPSLWPPPGSLGWHRYQDKWRHLSLTSASVSVAEPASHSLGLGLPSTSQGNMLLVVRGRTLWLLEGQCETTNLSFDHQLSQLIDKYKSCARAAKIFHDVGRAQAPQAWRSAEEVWARTVPQQVIA